MVDLNKPVRTVRGLPARVLCTDLKRSSGCTVAVAITYETGTEHIFYYRPDGSHPYNREEFALVNIPEEKSYFRVYSERSLTASGIYYSLGRCREIHPNSDIIEYVEVDGELAGVVLHKKALYNYCSDAKMNKDVRGE